MVKSLNNHKFTRQKKCDKISIKKKTFHRAGNWWYKFLFEILLVEIIEGWTKIFLFFFSPSVIKDIEVNYTEKNYDQIGDRLFKISVSSELLVSITFILIHLKYVYFDLAKLQLQ